MEILSIILNILATPAILVGLVAMIGLILQKKPVEEVVKGTVKTIVGFLILTAGSSFLQTGSLNDFGTLFNYAFGVQGVVPNNEAIVSLGLEKFATETAMIMCVGMIANIVMARFSRLNYIFLSGHVTLYMACMLAVILNVGGLEGTMLIVAGGLLLGLIMVLSPAVCMPTMKKVMKTDTIALGHFGGIGYWMAGQIGRIVRGKKEHITSTEDIKFPQRISFLRDTTVAIGLTMVVFYLVVTCVAIAKGGLTDPVISKMFLSQDTQTHWIVWSIIKGLNFAGGVFIILSGVRLIIGEIVPAFKGIAEKLVPNAKPALDCPIIFPSAPNAVLIGFLVSFLGGIVGLFVLGLLNNAGIVIALILPGVIPHFFCGATAGVFANAEGGLKGCVIGSFIHGLVITFLPAICMPVMGALNFANCTFSDADFSITGIILGNISRYIQGNGLFIIAVALFLTPIVYNYLMPNKIK